jgi:DNA-binding MarR family transcriptional regulator
MASVYIGFAQENDSATNSVTSMSAAVSSIRRSAEHLSQMLTLNGLPDRLAHKTSDAKAESLRHVSQIRNVRNQLFGDDIFFDPSWSILLDLYQRELEGRRVMVSDACAASGVPATTGLRWLKMLEKRGYVVRTQDPTDRRRVFVALTPEASERMSKVADTIVNEFYEI